MAFYEYIANNIHFTLKAIHKNKTLSILFNGNLVMLLPMKRNFNMTLKPFKDLLNFKPAIYDYDDHRFTVKKVSGGGVYLYVNNYSENTVTSHYISSRKLLLENIDMLYPELINHNGNEKYRIAKYDLQKIKPNVIKTKINGVERAALVIGDLAIPLQGTSISLNDLMECIQSFLKYENTTYTIDQYTIDCVTYKKSHYLRFIAGKVMLMSFNIGNALEFNTQINQLMKKQAKVKTVNIELLNTRLDRIHRYYTYACKLQDPNVSVKPKKVKTPVVKEALPCHQKLIVNEIITHHKEGVYHFIFGQLDFQTITIKNFEINKYTDSVISRLTSFLTKEVNSIDICNYKLTQQMCQQGFLITANNRIDKTSVSYLIENPIELIKKLEAYIDSYRLEYTRNDPISVHFKIKRSEYIIKFPTIIELMIFYREHIRYYNDLAKVGHQQEQCINININTPIMINNVEHPCCKITGNLSLDDYNYFLTVLKMSLLKNIP